MVGFSIHFRIYICEYPLQCAVALMVLAAHRLFGSSSERSPEARPHSPSGIGPPTPSRMSSRSFGRALRSRSSRPRSPPTEPSPSTTRSPIRKGLASIWPEFRPPAAISVSFVLGHMTQGQRRSSRHTRRGRAPAPTAKPRSRRRPRIAAENRRRLPKANISTHLGTRSLPASTPP